MSDSECVFVISVCDPVLGDHGSMVRLLVILCSMYCMCSCVSLLMSDVSRCIFILFFVPLMCVGGF